MIDVPQHWSLKFVGNNKTCIFENDSSSKVSSKRDVATPNYKLICRDRRKLTAVLK